MATRKKRTKGKKKKSAAVRAAEARIAKAAGDGEDAVDHDDDEDGEEDPGVDASSDDASDDDGDDAASAPARKRKGLKGRARKTRQDPDAAAKEVIPSPDGPRVSNHGGLVFVVVILGLIGVAIVAQFIVGN